MVLEVGGGVSGERMGGWGSLVVGDDGQVEREVVRVWQGEAMTVGGTLERWRGVGHWEFLVE